jgi:branched-chain amino acid transport system ATP-binding protein
MHSRADAPFRPGLRPSAEAEAATQEALALVGLADKGDVVAGALPVLDRKLLMLAGAMATRPKLLLMDEPVGGLTHAEIDLMMETVRRIKAQGVTIILIEHVMRFLVALSDRVMILHHGERIYEGPAAGLVRDRTVVDVYLGEGASARLAALLPGSAP